MMPLVLADTGEELTIQRIGGSAEVKRHLENLRFVVGGTVMVITALNGNVIVKVKEARVAISENGTKESWSDLLICSLIKRRIRG